MELRVNGHVFSLYNEVMINLKYDCIADTFTFKFYFDPTNPVHRNTFRPGSYHSCTITHGGVLVMTGTVLYPSFGSAGDPPKQLITVSGYSKTGVLEESCVLNTKGGVVIDNTSQTNAIPPSPLQFNGLTLEQISRLVTAWYEISVVVDSELQKDSTFTTAYAKTDTKPDQTVKDYLDMLCKQKNVVLSHTQKGELLITRAKSDSLLTKHTTFVKTKPVGGEGQAYVETTGTTKKDRAILFDFTSGPGKKWTSMSLDFDGQAMHRVIQVVGQDSAENSISSSIVNPYVAAGVTRYRRVIQTSNSKDDAIITARSILNDELKSIVLKIEIDGWTLGGNLVTPNQMVTVVNPEIGLYKKSKWFVQDVLLKGNESKESALLTCVPPCCFNNEPIINVFE